MYRSFQYHIMTLGKLLTLIFLSPSSMIWYWQTAVILCSGEGNIALSMWYRLSGICNASRADGL